jgi:osmotically-inducible protein OsmY
MATVEHAQPEPPHLARTALTPDDLNLQAEVEEAIWRYEPLRVLHAPLSAEVRDGEVTLLGVVPSRIIQYELIELLERIPGVRAVHDRSMTDPDIDQAVTLALGQSPETQAFGAAVNVLSRNGFVQLTGTVPDAGAIEAALRVVQGVPGVRKVANLLRTEAPSS